MTFTVMASYQFGINFGKSICGSRIDDNTMDLRIPLVRLAGMSSLNSFVSSFGDLLISPSPRDIIAEVSVVCWQSVFSDDDSMSSVTE